MKVIIVGGVAGGASCAARLRRLDEHAEVRVPLGNNGRFSGSSQSVSASLSPPSPLDTLLYETETDYHG